MPKITAEIRSPTMEAKVYRATAAQAGAQNYETLENKPSINGVALSGDKTSAELDLQPEMAEFSNQQILDIWNNH